MHSSSKKKIRVVTLGGGGGHSALVRAIQGLPVKLTALCNTADDGGGSGQLMKEYGVHHPGEVRRVLSAFDTKSEVLNFRFGEGKLKGQTIGNILLAGLELEYGSFDKAIQTVQNMFHIPFSVFPLTEKPVVLHAKTVNGKKIVGQANLVKHLWANSAESVEKLWIEPKEIVLHPMAKQALEQADKIFISMGDMYSSIAPCLGIKELDHIFRKTQAEIIWLPNVIFAPGQIHYVSVLSALEFFQTLSPHFFPNTIIFPQEKISKDVEKTLKQKGYGQTIFDVTKDHGIRLVQTELFEKKRVKHDKIGDSIERSPIHYNNDALKKVIQSIL